ncbi:Copper homeostasis protein CutC [Coccomyxa sp. Obi]|nr:Copper homeostasis protein CutC [Coccomyxa sp. Obi]
MVAPAPAAAVARSVVEVEFCVDSLSAAVQAQRVGATRIELCSGLSEGGLTPSCGLIKAVRAALKIPVHVLIRPRGGDFLYSTQELLVMREDLLTAAELGVNGVVMGMLTQEGDVDAGRLSDFMLLCRSLGLDFTFHRAFDMTRDKRYALEALITCGVPRLLTSGGAHSALQGSTAIRDLVEQAQGRISIMAGGGVRAKTAELLVSLTGVSSLHASASGWVESGMMYKNRRLSLCSKELLTDWRWRSLDESSAAALCITCDNILRKDTLEGAWQCLTFRA